jgi:hypothetical protein
MNENYPSNSIIKKMKNPINRGQLFLRSMVAVTLFIIGIIFSLLSGDYSILIVDIIIAIFFMLGAIYAEITNPPGYVVIGRDGILFQGRYFFKDRLCTWDEFELIVLYSDSERYQGVHIKKATIWIRDSTDTIFVSYEIALAIIDECYRITGKKIRNVLMC